jgi:hypothetical protein
MKKDKIENEVSTIQNQKMLGIVKPPSTFFTFRFS